MDLHDFQELSESFLERGYQRGEGEGERGKGLQGPIKKKKLIYLQKLMKNHSVSHNFSAQYELLKLTMIKTEMKAGF